MGAGLLGRVEQVLVLLESLNRASKMAETTVCLVRGEPGIGKSTLLRAFAAYSALADLSNPILIGSGQAMPNALGSDAHQAVRECLRSLVSRAERTSVDDMQRVHGALHTCAPDWVESVPITSLPVAAGMGSHIARAYAAHRSSDSRLDQLTAMVRELCRSGPVVLILDDLHWADIATIDVLVALALKVEGPLMLVYAYRSDELRPTADGEPHPLTRALFRLRRYKPGCVEIDLTRLTREDTVRLIRAAHRAENMSELTARKLAEQSAGVPLFAESLADIHSRGSVTLGDDTTFRQITAVMEERLLFASNDDQRLLEAALAVGFAFEVEVLADLVRQDVDDVYDRLDNLMRDHHLVVEAEPVGPLDRYAFAHPLLAEVLRLRHEKNNTRWRRYHRRLVDILLAQPTSDEVSVRAAMSAVTADDPRSGLLCLAAATRQYRAGAVTRARELSRLALARFETSGASSEDYFDAAELLARCLSAEANHREAAAVCAHTLEAGHTRGVAIERVSQLTMLHVRSLRMVSEWDRAARILIELEADLPAAAVLFRSECLMLRAEIALCGPVQDTAACIELCEQVVGLTSDCALVSRAYGHRGLAFLAAYQPDEAEEWLRRAVGVAQEDDHPYLVYETLHWLSKKKIACLELDDAWSLLDELASTSDVSGVAQDSPFHQRDSSRVLGLMGRPEDAAAAFVAYYDGLDDRPDQDRALTVLTCQVAELNDLLGNDNGQLFLSRVHLLASARERNDGARLTDAVKRLDDQRGSFDCVDFAARTLEVSQQDAEAAEAIFRFDVPDLARLRRNNGIR